MTKIDYLKELTELKKPYIIYKSNKGFDLYTDFSKKIILTNNNIKSFINKATQFKFKKKQTDIFIGFFGYEILNNLIGVKIKKQKGLKFPKGIFYKPETKVKLQKKLNYKNLELIKSNKPFKVNINKPSYKVIFDKFKKKLNLVKPIKLRSVQNIVIQHKLML